MTLKEKFELICGDKIYNSKYSLQCEKISDDYAIEFVEWKDNNQYVRLIDGNWVSLIIDIDAIYTSKELLEIFKKEKGL